MRRSRFIAYDLLELGGADLRERPQARAARALEARARARSRRSGLSPVETGAELGRRSPRCARVARRAASKASCSSTATARYGTGRRKQDDSPAAPGGSGRSIRSASTACSSTRRPATAAARASTPTTPSRSGTARRATPPRRKRRSTAIAAHASRRPPDALQLVPSPRPIRASPTRSSRAVDRVIRAHDAREVRPGAQRAGRRLVFELGFEGINRSARHKSGIAVRFPRMLRIRDDKPLHEADTLPSWRRCSRCSTATGEVEGSRPGEAGEASAAIAATPSREAGRYSRTRSGSPIVAATAGSTGATQVVPVCTDQRWSSPFAAARPITRSAASTSWPALR